MYFYGIDLLVYLNLGKEKKNNMRNQTNKNKQCHKNYKENTGTKLISNTKKHKLKI